MKKTNLKNISLALASAAVFAGLGGITLKNNVTASAAVQEKNLSEIFSVSNAVIMPETVADVKVAAFDVSDEGSVWVKRDLALKWFTEDGAKYLTAQFSLTSLDLISFSISMDTPSAWATEDGRSNNVITFTKASGNDFTVSVNDEGDTTVALAANTPLTLKLGAGDMDGEMSVSINDTPCGNFVNVGGAYADYEYNKYDSLKFAFDLKAEDDTTEKSTTLLIHDINGQSFENLTDEDKVKDTAAPVVVINDELYGFALGTQFSLDYVVLDVFQDTGVSKEIKAYQYNPNHTSDSDEYEKLETLSTNSYFGTTVHGDTTVYAELGAEYVAIEITAWDSTFNGTEGNKKAIYNLAWYTTPSRVRTDLTANFSYIPVDISEEGPSYNTKYVWNEGTETLGMTQAAFEATQEYKDFEAALEKALEDVYAGTSSESYVNIPSLKWFFDLNNTYGYRNMKFTISYRKPGASSNSSATSLSYNGLRFTADKEGKYEFKVFASDKQGNPMKYYVDGELVEVSAENVWDIDAIPYFHFELADKGLKVKDSTSNTSRKSTAVLDSTYTMTSLTVLGASSLKQDYALYKLDVSAYNKTASVRITEEHLIGITFESIAENLTDVVWADQTDFFAVYLNAYATELAERLGNGVTAQSLLDSGLFVRIQTEGDRVNGKEADDVYKWKPSSKSFATVEEGYFFILADYWEELNTEQRATAYKVVLVQSKKATITGESQWWKDNLVSVILFAISGVLLIAVIVLLFIKPSEETLEDLDKKSTKRSSKHQDE